MAEAVDNPQEGADVQPTVPEWVPEKFREAPEKFAESYSQLEQRLGQQGNELGQIKEAYGELQQQLEQLTAQSQQQTPDQNEALYEAFEQDPIRTMQYLFQQNNQVLMSQMQQSQQQASQPQYEAQSELLAAQADQVMGRTHDDWEQYKPEVAKLIEERPYLLPETSLGSLTGVKDALETAYEVVKAKSLLSQAAEQNVNAADLLRQQKLQAQTLAGAAGRPTPQEDDGSYWERVKNAQIGSYADSL